MYDPVRLLRQSWANPDELARELYVMLVEGVKVPAMSPSQGSPSRPGPPRPAPARTQPQLVIPPVAQPVPLSARIGVAPATAGLRARPAEPARVPGTLAGSQPQPTVIAPTEITVGTLFPPPRFPERPGAAAQFSFNSTVTAAPAVPSPAPTARAPLPAAEVFLPQVQVTETPASPRLTPLEPSSPVQTPALRDFAGPAPAVRPLDLATPTAIAPLPQAPAQAPTLTPVATGTPPLPEIQGFGPDIELPPFQLSDYPRADIDKIEPGQSVADPIPELSFPLNLLKTALVKVDENGISGYQPPPMSLGEGQPSEGEGMPGKGNAYLLDFDGDHLDKEDDDPFEVYNLGDAVGPDTITTAIRINEEFWWVQPISTKPFMAICPTGGIAAASGGPPNGRPGEKDADIYRMNPETARYEFVENATVLNVMPDPCTEGYLLILLSLGFKAYLAISQACKKF